jgi:hypothetical protein
MASCLDPRLNKQLWSFILEYLCIFVRLGVHSTQQQNRQINFFSDDALVTFFRPVLVSS